MLEKLWEKGLKGNKEGDFGDGGKNHLDTKSDVPNGPNLLKKYLQFFHIYSKIQTEF